MSFGKLTAAGASTDVLNARVRLPGWGTWSALVTLARGDSTLTGPVVLTLGPLVLSGTIRRGSPFVGRGSYRIFGGADGWQKTVPPISYRNPQTTLSKLAQDVAAVVGESIVMDTAGERVVGPCARSNGPASSLLNTYSPSRWWVEIDGTTHIGDRTPLPSPSVRVLDYDPALGVVVVSDDAAVIMPGQLFASGTVTGTVSTVHHDLEGSTLRTEVYLA